MKKPGAPPLALFETWARRAQVAYRQKPFADFTPKSAKAFCQSSNNPTQNQPTTRTKTMAIPIESTKKSSCRETPLPELHCCACRGCGEPMLLAWDGQTNKYGGMCPFCGIFSPLRSAEDA